MLHYAPNTKTLFDLLSQDKKILKEFLYNYIMSGKEYRIYLIGRYRQQIKERKVFEYQLQNGLLEV